MVDVNDFDDDDDYFDAREQRITALPSWMEFYNDELPMGLAIEKLLRDMLYFSRDSQYKILSSYFMSNSRVAMNSGYLLHQGKTSTGKSQFIKLISKVFDIPTLLANSTGVGIRNHLNNLKYYLDDEGKPLLFKNGKPKEKDGYFLLVDNLSLGNLTNNDNLYQLLLGGYDITTSKISIGGKNGKNLEFNAFGFKILSSIEPLHLIPELSELSTRLLIIHHESPPHGIIPPIKVDSVNWDGLKFAYLAHWSRAKILEYGDTYSKINSDKKILALWEDAGLSSRQWQVSLELMCSGLISGVWSNASDATNHFIRYFEESSEDSEKSESSIKLLCEDYISQTVGFRIEAYLEQGKLEQAKSVSFPTSPFKDYLNECNSEGKLDDIPTPSRIAKIMRSLGWKQGREGHWIQI